MAATLFRIEVFEGDVQPTNPDRYFFRIKRSGQKQLTSEGYRSIRTRDRVVEQYRKALKAKIVVLAKPQLVPPSLAEVAVAAAKAQADANCQTCVGNPAPLAPPPEELPADALPVDPPSEVAETAPAASTTAAMAAANPNE